MPGPTVLLSVSELLYYSVDRDEGEQERHNTVTLSQSHGLGQLSVPSTGFVLINAVSEFSIHYVPGACASARAPTRTHLIIKTADSPQHQLFPHAI